MLRKIYLSNVSFLHFILLHCIINWTRITIFVLRNVIFNSIRSVQFYIVLYLTMPLGVQTIHNKTTFMASSALLV